MIFYMGHYGITDRGGYVLNRAIGQTDQTILAQKLIDIKQRGYEINRGERELEVATIAAPIWDHERKIAAAITISGPVQRFSKDHEAKPIAHLLDAGRKISEMLGASV